jgi:hypothetical protein
VAVVMVVAIVAVVVKLGASIQWLAEDENLHDL